VPTVQSLSKLLHESCELYTLLLLPMLNVSAKVAYIWLLSGLNTFCPLGPVYSTSELIRMWFFKNEM